MTIESYKKDTGRAAAAWYADHPYAIKRDGKVKYAAIDSVYADRINMNFTGNRKTGRVAVINLSIFYSCDHSQLCYPGANHDGAGACYGCAGCYVYARNQVLYAENVAYFRKHGPAAFAAEVLKQCRIAGVEKLRFFTVGDFYSGSFIGAAFDVAAGLPEAKIWCYTKRIIMFNSYVKKHGGPGCIPSNFNVIYSLWTGDAGVIPVNNPYNLPEAVFIPYGRERELLPRVTYVCPCASQDSVTDCDHCGICAKLQRGESVGFLEHSTTLSRARDKIVARVHNLLRGRRDALAEYEKAVAAGERIRAAYAKA